MQIDTANFPLVWMRTNAPNNSSEISPFTELEELLARKQAFVLLNDEGLERGEHEHSSQEMKETSRWMKRNKSDLKAFVKAAIYVEPSAAKRLVTKAFAVGYEKFWGCPMLMTATKDEAISLAEKLIDESTNSRSS